MATHSSLTLIDRDVALARVGGDVDLLKEIAVLFLEDYPRVLLELRGALETGDAKSIERTAHGLKGSVANFGARAVVEVAFLIEQLGRAGKLAEVPPALNSLELALAELHVELASL